MRPKLSTVSLPLGGLLLVAYRSTLAKPVDPPPPPMLDRRDASESFDAGVWRPVALRGGLLDDDSDESGRELPPAETENRGRSTTPAVDEG